MSRVDRTEQILRIKGRNGRDHAFASYKLRELKTQWSSSGGNAKTTPDFFVIRAVTILEVFTRQHLASLIDHSEQYTERAVELSKHFKMDFDLLRHIQGRVITLGDIVAHSVPVNSFAQILSYFETLLRGPIRPLLCQAVDRWAVEIETKTREPIIHDFDRMAERITRLFEVRHIICHELPSKSVYCAREIDEFLEEAIRFTASLGEVMTFERFGLVPLTQTEMNIAAGEELRQTEEEMKVALSELQSRVKANEDGFSREWLDSLTDAQEKWLAYRNAQCHMDTFLYRGGSIIGALWGSEATRLTKLRIDELKASLNKVSGPEYA